MTVHSRTANIFIDPDRLVGDISPLLFSGFAEHMGRCIYEGIFDPGSAGADAGGLRADVKEALGELNYRSIRYPGGNFLSGYHWLDGVGDKAKRPRRRELAWKSTETNQFGTNEFIEFCRKIGTEPMLGLNFGTGTIDEAAALVEYCNTPTGSAWADLRASHGYREPHKVKYWCVGNEMDGPWQIGHMGAQDYANKAREAAKLMKWHDPSIQLIACGSSGTEMSTYPEWDRVVMETCWEQVDYLSMHYYANNRAGDLGSYLGITRQFEDHIDTLAGMLRHVKAQRRSKHNVYLSWDEWNIWYKNMEMDGKWSEAPHLIEEIYNMEDALVVALWMNVFLRRSDVLKIACVAQIVNVIAPILTNASSLVKQTIFYPFQLFSKYAQGVALDVNLQSPMYSTKQYGDLPVLDVSVSYDAANSQSAVFVVNRSLKEPLDTVLTWQGAAPKAITTIYQMSDANPKASNTFEQPTAVVPVQAKGMPIMNGTVTISLPPMSFTVLVAK